MHEADSMRGADLLHFCPTMNPHLFEMSEEEEQEREEILQEVLQLFREGYPKETKPDKKTKELLLDIVEDLYWFRDIDEDYRYFDEGETYHTRYTNILCRFGLAIEKGIWIPAKKGKSI
jgi:hypothetical protein